MDLFEAIEKRRSVRIFQPVTVPENVIRKALSAALLAPSTSNIQPWEFYWVRDTDKKKKIIEACISQSAARTAAEIIVVVARTDTWKRNAAQILDRLKKIPSTPQVSLNYYTRTVQIAFRVGFMSIAGLIKGLVFMIMRLFVPMPDTIMTNNKFIQVSMKSTALACQNFMLAMTAQGYGSCPMEGFYTPKVKKVLGLNSKSHPVMVIAVGLPDAKGIYGDRLRLDEKLFIHTV